MRFERQAASALCRRRVRVLDDARTFASPVRHVVVGWPWWALWVQTAVAGVVVIMLAVVDFVLGFSRIQVSSAAPVSPTEEDDGALGVLVIPIALVLIAAVTAVAVVSVALVLGLPVRLRPAARRWIVKHNWVSLAVATVGVLLFIGAQVFAPGAPWPSGPLLPVPSSPLVSIALVVVAVGLCHFWYRRNAVDASQRG